MVDLVEALIANHPIWSSAVYAYLTYFIACLIWSNSTFYPYAEDPSDSPERGRLVVGGLALVWPILLPIILVLVLVYCFGRAAEISVALFGRLTRPRVKPPTVEEAIEEGAGRDFEEPETAGPEVARMSSQD
jgi:hypothetical protein